MADVFGRSRPVFRLLLIVAACGATLPLCADEPVPRATGSSRVQHLRTQARAFEVPFQLDAGETRRTGAVSAQLYVSEDQGRSWRSGATVPLSGTSFSFTALRDGEYFFAVRTVDAFGATWPPGELRPELIISIDTEPPTLELATRRLSADSVELQWSAHDASLAPDSLRIEVSLGDGRPVTLRTGELMAGRVPLRLAAGQSANIVGRVADQAGNVIRTEKLIRSEVDPAAVAPIGTCPQNGGALIRPSSNTSVSSPDPILERTRAASLSHPSPLPQPTASPGLVGPANVFLPPNDPLTNGLPQTPLPDLSRDVAPVTLPTSAESPSVSPPTYAASSPTLMTTIVDRRQFQIRYAVDEVGTSGVGTVTLYITQDGGGRWFTYGTDADRQSPAQARVPEDGTYGFAIRITNGAGLGDPPPKPGDVPEMQIVVDTRAPVVRLQMPDPTTRPNPSVIPIRWQTDESNPAPLGVRLAYAARPEGPWQSMTDWIADRGAYDWSVPPTAPGHVYVRLTARDAAGNVSHVALPQPIVVDLTKPAGRLLGVETRTGS